jgi:protocatechuate 3,4-dioxygenase beta subunit
MNRRRLMIGGGAAVLAIAVLAAWWMTRDGGGAQEAAGARATAARGAGRARAASVRRVDVATVARGAIAGTVRDPKGAAVAGAEVCAYASSPELSDDDTRDARCATSRADGRYRVASLLPASYEVHAGAPRFLPGRYRDRERRTSSLRLSAGQERGGIDIVLRPGGVELTGAVKDIGGGPVDGAWVRAGPETWGDVALAHARSGADGSFRMWVAPGGVHLIATADGYAEGNQSATVPGQRVEILLTPESVLAGRVVLAGSGAPVAGARVATGGPGSFGAMQEDSSPGAHGSAVTDEAGRFRLARLPPGRYKPVASTPDGHGEARESVLLGLGQTVDGALIELHPAALVVGRVLVAGNRVPCREGWVSLHDAKADRGAGGSVEDGRVEIKAVMPGSYEVEVGCGGFRAEDEYPALVIAAGTAPPEQEWTVRAGGRIRGAVRSADGEPVARAWISARLDSPEPRKSWRGGDGAATEEDGSFLIDGLRAGTYEVRVDVADLPVPEAPQRVAVAEGGEAAVELRLEEGGGVVGDVVDDAGRPVPRVTVLAQGRARWSFGNDSAQTRDDGSFSLDGLRPGAYRLVAMRAGVFGWGAGMRAPGKGDDDQSGQEVRVVAGETAHVRLVVESQSGAIRGRVADPQGSPITDAYVDAERESESAAAAAGSARRSMHWAWSRTPVLTDTDGKFALEKLSPGRYTVRAFRRSGGEALAEGVAVGASVTLTIRRTGSIAGKVSIAGGGAPETATVVVHDKQTGFTRSESFFRTGGAFVMRDLPAGAFEVSVEAAEGTGQTRAQLAEGQNRTGLSVELSARATLTGRVISLEDGKPLPGFMVRVQPVGGSRFSISMGSTAEELSDAAGRFRAENAPAGQVEVLLFPSDFRASDHGFGRRSAVLEGGRTTDIGDVHVPRRRLKLDESPGDLGFTLKENPIDTEPGSEVLAVAVVRKDGPAASAGLQVGDVIVSIDGHDVRAEPSLYWSLSKVSPGTTVALGLQRGAVARITAGPPR